MICINGKRPPDGEIPHPSRGPLHRLGWALPPYCGAGLPSMTLWERMGLYTLGKFLVAHCEPQWEVKLCVCVCARAHAYVLGVSVSKQPWKDGESANSDRACAG